MFKKNVIMLAALVFLFLTAIAQDKYFTKTGTISFFSSATLENIEAKNKTVTTVLDSKTGGLQFSVQMKGFEFEKALMQQHFNDNYVHSDKFPKADFIGTIINNKAVNYKKEGTYNVTVKGKLTLHGKTKDIQAPGTIKVEGSKLQAASVFTINLSDYNVEIPAGSKNKIANTIKIMVDAKLDPFNG